MAPTTRHKQGRYNGASMRTFSFPSLKAKTWSGLDHQINELKAIDGSDHRCGRRPPRTSKVTLPHVSIQDDDK